jgi:hypothetical protein
LMGSILWQSTVLALVVAGISFRFRHSSPSMRYWLWQIIANQLAMALSRRSAADYALVLVDIVSYASQPPSLKRTVASPLALNGGAGPAARAQPS